MFWVGLQPIQCTIVIFEMFSGQRSALGNSSGEPRIRWILNLGTPPRCWGILFFFHLANLHILDVARAQLPSVNSWGTRARPYSKFISALQIFWHGQEDANSKLTWLHDPCFGKCSPNQVFGRQTTGLHTSCSPFPFSNEGVRFS